MSDPTAPRADASGVASVTTHRLTPPGVLPRRGQVWLMVGVAGDVLAIILFTGNHAIRRRRGLLLAASSVAALAPNPEQLRTYQRRLEAADTRPQAPPISLQDLRPTPRAADESGLRDQGSARRHTDCRGTAASREPEPFRQQRRPEPNARDNGADAQHLAAPHGTPGTSGDLSAFATVPGRCGRGGCARVDGAHEHNLSLTDSCADELRTLAHAGACA